MGSFCMKCEHCGSFLKEGEGYDFHGKTLCEDCYMYETNPPKACDPMAVSSALSIRKQLGQSGIADLTELQKRIYSEIEKKGKITREELQMTVNIRSEELDQEFAILRHCELIRALKEGSKVYLTKW
jgi:hypothetical protein